MGESVDVFGMDENSLQIHSRSKNYHAIGENHENCIYSIFIAYKNSFAQDFFQNQKTVAQKHLATVQSSNSISGYPVLIPDEPWKFMFSGVYQTTGTGSGLPFGEVYGVKVSDSNIVQYAIDIQANLAQRADIGDWTDEPCKGSDHLWMSSIGGKFKDINCATINFNSEFKNHNASVYLNVFGKARNISYSIPATTIQVLFVRYGSAGRRLQYKININPIYHGFKPEDESNKSINGWNKLFYVKDVNKKKFIENVSKWAADIQKNMDKAYGGDLEAFVGVPKYSDYLKANISVNIERESVEEKLRNLKSLFEKNLINERQYDEQVKSIFTGN